jgi:hypothetical protein
VLDVLATKEGWAPFLGAQQVEEAEQAYRQPQAHIHLTEVNEDHHQHDGVRHQVLELKAVVLQQREEEGGEWGHEPGQGV